MRERGKEEGRKSKLTCSCRLLQGSPAIPHGSLEPFELLGHEHLRVLGEGGQDLDGRFELFREDDPANQVARVLDLSFDDLLDLLAVGLGSLLVCRSGRVGGSSFTLVVAVAVVRFGHFVLWKGEEERELGGKEGREGRARTKSS